MRIIRYFAKNASDILKSTRDNNMIKSFLWRKSIRRAWCSILIFDEFQISSKDNEVSQGILDVRLSLLYCYCIVLFVHCLLLERWILAKTIPPYRKDEVQMGNVFFESIADLIVRLSGSQ